MKHLLKITSQCLLIAVLCWTKTYAQATGSSATYGGSVAITGIQSDVAESLYIGPGTYTVNGTWEIYSKNVIIDPAAVINGTGTIQFYNPSVAGGSSSATLVDGNNATNPIDVNIVLNNAQGMIISELPFPADLTGAGFTNNTTTSSLNIGKNFDLAVDGANVTLGSGVVGDFNFDSDATITGYSINRMVITNNSTLNHMVKQNYTSSFVFPVGIAVSDFTPATVSPSASGTVHVSVQDYANAPPTILIKSEGMDRTWHIYADAALPGSLTLQHNSPATDGSAYDDMTAFITQKQAGGEWSSPGTVDFVSTGLHTNAASYTLTNLPGDDNSYFTKASDVDTPLPVTLISFDASGEKNVVHLTWSTSSEVNSQSFGVERSADARTWQQLAIVAANGLHNAIQYYAYTDKNPVSGSNFYRLKMLDLDGSFAYSKIRLITRDRAPETTVFPNPTSGPLNVVASDWRNVKEIRIFNLDGKSVYYSGPNPVATLILSNVPAGIHFLNLIRFDGSVEQKKIVIAR